MTKVESLVLAAIRKHSEGGKFFSISGVAAEIGIPDSTLRQHLNQFMLYGILRLDPGVQEIGADINKLFFGQQTFRTGIVHPRAQSSGFDRHALEYIDLFGERWTGEIRELPEGAYITEATCHNEEADRASMVFNSGTPQANLLTAESWWWVRRWSEGTPWDHDGWFRINGVPVARFELVTEPTAEQPFWLSVQPIDAESPTRHLLMLHDHLKGNIDHRRAVIGMKFAEIVASMMVDNDLDKVLSFALMSGVALATFEEDDMDWAWAQNWYNSSGVQVNLKDPLPDGLSEFAITAPDNDVECLKEWIDHVYSRARDWATEVACELNNRGMSSSRWERLEPFDVPESETPNPVLPGIDESSAAEDQEPNIWECAEKLTLAHEGETYDVWFMLRGSPAHPTGNTDYLRVFDSDGAVVIDEKYEGKQKLPNHPGRILTAIEALLSAKAADQEAEVPSE